MKIRISKDMKSEINNREIIEYFNNLGPSWDEHVGNDSERRKSIRKVFEMIDLKPGYRVLDVGSGNGVLIPIIEEKIGPGGVITAVDSAQSMIDRARQLYSEYDNIEYVTSIVEEMDSEPETYDAVLCFSVFPHIADKRKALQNFNRMIKTGGRLYIFHLSDTASLNSFHSSLNSPVRHDMLPGREELTSMIELSGFVMKNYIDRTGLNFVESEKC